MVWPLTWSEPTYEPANSELINLSTFPKRPLNGEVFLCYDVERMKKFTLLSLFLALIFISPIAARAQDTSKLDYSSLLKILEQLRSQKAVPSVTVTPVDGVFKPVDVPVAFKIGESGPEVRAIQEKLRASGDFTYPEITGYYGKVTDDAVKKYEARTKEKILKPQPIARPFPMWPVSGAGLGNFSVKEINAAIAEAYSGNDKTGVWKEIPGSKEYSQFQSGPINCNGANTCIDGLYNFAQISRVAVNSSGNVAVVAVNTGYVYPEGQLIKKGDTQVPAVFPTFAYGGPRPTLYPIEKKVDGRVVLGMPYRLYEYPTETEFSRSNVSDLNFKGENLLFVLVTGQKNYHDTRGLVDASDTYPFTVQLDRATDMYQLVPGQKTEYPTPITSGIQVISPNGGEGLALGTTYRVAWNTKYNFPADIFLVDQTALAPIQIGDEYTGYFDWVVGKRNRNSDREIKPGSYFIKVCVLADPSDEKSVVCDQSDSYFKIYSDTQTGEPKPGVFGIMSSVPSSGAVDARMPSNPDGSTVSGWQTFELIFNEGNAAKMRSLKPSDFLVKNTGAGSLKVSSVEVLGENNIRVKLDKPIPVGQWTLIVHEDSGTYANFGFLPADSNGDGVVNSTDLLLLIDVNNQAKKAEVWQVDIDRSGVVNILDQLMWINLINGADAFDIWLNKSLPPLYGN